MAVVVAGAVAVAAAVEVVAGAVATLLLLVTAAGKAHVATLMASVTPSERCFLLTFYWHDDFKNGVNTGMEYCKLGNVCIKRRTDSSTKG